jgi:hypothetical protein
MPLCPSKPASREIPNEYIHLDPRDNLNKNLWCGRLLKLAALSTLVAYTVLATVAALAIGFTAPAYLPITILASYIFAELAISVLYQPLNNISKIFYNKAKVSQGIIDELNKLGDNKSNYLKARYYYFKHRISKCKNKMKEYEKIAKSSGKINGPALEKTGKWFDKKLQSKCTAAYCLALMDNKRVKIPEIIAQAFIIRSYESKFLRKSDFLKLSNGKILSAASVETLSLTDLSKKILRNR